MGSVGTRCYVVLLLGDRADDPLLLQVKQAIASVLEPYAGRSHRFDGAVADFAEAYADRTEADHAAFARAGEGLTAPGAGRSAATNQRKGAEG